MDTPNIDYDEDFYYSKLEFGYIVLTVMAVGSGAFLILACCCYKCFGLNIFCCCCDIVKKCYKCVQFCLPPNGANSDNEQRDNKKGNIRERRRTDDRPILPSNVIIIDAEQFRNYARNQ